MSLVEETFQDVDSAIFEMVWQWAKKRHNNKPRRWIKEKYFQVHEGRNWVFSGEVIGRDGAFETVRLFRAAQTPIKRHTKVQAAANPYDPTWEVYARETPRRENGKHIERKKALAYPLETAKGTLPSLPPKDYQTDRMAQPSQGLAFQRWRKSAREPCPLTPHLSSTTSQPRGQRGGTVS